MTKTNPNARALYTRYVHELPISTARAIIREYPEEEDYIEHNYREQVRVSSRAFDYIDRIDHIDNSVELSMRWRAAKTICQKGAK